MANLVDYNIKKSLVFLSNGSNEKLFVSKNQG